MSSLRDVLSLSNIYNYTILKKKIKVKKNEKKNEKKKEKKKEIKKEK